MVRGFPTVTMNHPFDPFGSHPFPNPLGLPLRPSDLFCCLLQRNLPSFHQTHHLKPLHLPLTQNYPIPFHRGHFNFAVKGDISILLPHDKRASTPFPEKRHHPIFIRWVFTLPLMTGLIPPLALLSSSFKT